MSQISEPDPRALPKGDRLHRRASRWALAALLATALTLPVFLFIKPIWHAIVGLGTPAFLAASFSLGLIMAAGPVAVLACALVALFLRVEACFAPCSKPRITGNRLAILVGALVSFAPAIAACYPPFQALRTGYIAFRGIGQQYPMASDPYGFWQAVSFWLMGAATLAILAVIYWRAKLKSRRPRHPA